MATETITPNPSNHVNKYQVGPGLGLVLMGALYLVFWLLPVTVESYVVDPRWSHNWVYALIILTIGASFYQRSVVSRTIGLIQGLLMPLTASGAFNTDLMTLIAVGIGVTWLVVTGLERQSKKLLLQGRLSTHTWNWINMHFLILSWLLIAHMGFIFFLGRLPFEAELDTLGISLGRNIGFLVNLPIERYDLVTYVFDINLILLTTLFLYEQFKMGYNLKQKPWPRLSFWFLWITFALGLVLLPINLQGILYP